MYAAMIGRSAMRVAEKIMKGAGSGMTWIIVLVLLLIVVGVAKREKGRGDLTKLKSGLITGSQTPAVAAPQPGGQDAIVLTRAQRTGSIMPEFLSATLLPGRGMNVLQITAFVPSKGEIPLLVSPSLAEAANRMIGSDTDINGGESLNMGGAIEAPWANQISGAVFPGGTTILANWQGRGLTLPVNGPGSTGGQTAIGGFLLKRGADSVKSNVMPDGGIAEATFHAGDFDGHWPSKTDIQMTVLLSGQQLELTVVAKNVGSEPQPMGIGWYPRFAIPSGNRAQATLRLPVSLRAESSEHGSGLPTGKLLPVEGTPYDFSSSHTGTALKSLSLNDSFVHLKAGPLDNGAETELTDPASGYGLRITALSPSIKALHVSASENDAFVSINPQTNYDDPLGHEWSKDEDTGMVVLQPGESLQWRVRLELFLPAGHMAQGK